MPQLERSSTLLLVRVALFVEFENSESKSLSLAAASLLWLLRWFEDLADDSTRVITTDIMTQYRQSDKQLSRTP